MLSELSNLVESYRSKLKLRLVVLFGSRARGDYTDWSDIDVLVVADDLPRDPRDCFAVLRDIGFARVHPIGFNTESFLKKLREGSTFIIEILEEGKILFEDTDFLKEVMNIYKEVRSRYARQGRTWTMISPT
ncbi:MAG: nucleotidyltransferase domain-containing protein [Desulfurococcaceae archaeon]